MGRMWNAVVHSGRRGSQRSGAGAAAYSGYAGLERQSSRPWHRSHSQKPARLRHFLAIPWIIQKGILLSVAFEVTTGPAGLGHPNAKAFEVDLAASRTLIRIR
jgi:hypothetical protein